MHLTKRRRPAIPKGRYSDNVRVKVRVNVWVTVTVLHCRPTMARFSAKTAKMTKSDTTHHYTVFQKTKPPNFGSNFVKS